jgi:hypothetical protein
MSGASEWVPIDGDEALQVHTEIEMYLEAMSLAWEWFFYVHRCRDPNFGEMTQDDALQERWLADETSVFDTHCLDSLPGRISLIEEEDEEPCYHRSYAEYDSRTREVTNRNVVLLGVGLLRREMLRLQPLIRDCLTAENQPERCTELDEHLQTSEHAFDAWEAVALRALVPAVQADLRSMDETRRRVTLEHGKWQEHLRTLADGEGNLLEKCTFCAENIRDVVYMPCKHFVSCHRCAVEWKMRSGSGKCPFCIRPADIVSVRIFTNGTTVVPFQQHARLAACDIGSLLADLQSMCTTHPPPKL